MTVELVLSSLNAIKRQASYTLVHSSHESYPRMKDIMILETRNYYLSRLLSKNEDIG